MKQPLEVPAGLVWLGLLGVALAIGGQYAWNWWMNWKLDQTIHPIPGALVPMRYSGPVQGAELALVVNRAIELMVVLGPWLKGTLFEALARVNGHVAVQKVNLWSDGFGKLVGGQLVGNVMKVGLDLTVLAHELSHLVEVALTGKTDMGELPGSKKHPNWMVNGLDKVDREYRVWLRLQTKA